MTHIRYRDKRGRFISVKSAKRRKPTNVRTELAGKDRRTISSVDRYVTTIRVKPPPPPPPPPPPEIDILDPDILDPYDEFPPWYDDDYSELEELDTLYDFEPDVDFYEEP